MRTLLVSTLLALTASCAWPPPPQSVGAPPAPGVAPPVALIPAPPPAAAVPAAASPVVASPVVAPPAPVVAAAPAPPVVDYVPLGLIWLRRLNAPAPGGRLTLSNFTFQTARVQAVPAAGPDCAVPAGAAVAEFTLPLNGTRIIPAPAGTDICWRREVPPAASQGAVATQPWTEWNRALTASGRFIDSRL